MRLEKYLADCNLGTRSECKVLIKRGRITVDGEIVRDGSRQVQGTEAICLDSALCRLSGDVYYMFHKPKNCVCANCDNLHKTVLDYFDKTLRKGLLIVGRLDLDTEGLLLLTTDGAFLHRLMSPKHHVQKTYFFKAKGILERDSIEKVRAGIDIGDEKPTKPGELVIFSEDGSLVTGTLTISEGRFHQVKRMLLALGAEVVALKRISIGELQLDSKLAPGCYRELTQKELEMLG